MTNEDVTPLAHPQEKCFVPVVPEIRKGAGSGQNIWWNRTEKMNAKKNNSQFTGFIINVR